MFDTTGIWWRMLRRANMRTLGERIARRLGRLPAEQRVRWYGASSRKEALDALATRAHRLTVNLAPGGIVLCVGSGDDFHQQLGGHLQRLDVAYRELDLRSLGILRVEEASAVSLVLCAYLDARHQTQLAREVMAHPVLSEKPLEYVAGLDHAAEKFKRYDEYPDTFFVSPALIGEPSPYEIYEESLQRFEQKCGLRDYLDLYQLLKSAVENGLPGDVAEFGSFRGHGGWLISRTLEALGSDKRLYMFDTFESFPRESGVDHFWSGTHGVNFDEVRAKFTDRPAVTLIKGDFTRTLKQSPVRDLCLAYVDCDSYRATRYLLEILPDRYLVSRGFLVCEDYGHPALLGNRAAVHEALDGKPGWIRFFSQFSGLYIGVKP